MSLAISALPRSAKDRSASRTAAVFVPELRFAGAHGGAIRPADDSVVGLHHGVGEEHLPLDGSQLTAVLPIWKDRSRRDRKRSMTACAAQIPQAWLDAVSAITPAWVSAVSAATVALLGLAVVARWWLLRRVLRGSAAAIIALLGESERDVMPLEGGSSDGGRRWRPSSHGNRVVYLVVGEEHYWLCASDLDRLREQGYVIREGERGGSHRLSRLGQILLERPGNDRLLARGVARARRRHDRFPNCYGGSWFRCRCKTYRIRLARYDVPLPFFVGELLRVWADRRFFRRP